jgi:hypothetical protein
MAWIDEYTLDSVLDVHGQTASAAQSAHHIGKVPHNSLQQLVAVGSVLRQLICFPVPLQGRRLHSIRKVC